MCMYVHTCAGEGNGSPLQCSCLENPVDGGAWWAAVYGVTQSRTRLQRLSSSSSIHLWTHTQGFTVAQQVQDLCPDAALTLSLQISF